VGAALAAAMLALGGCGGGSGDSVSSGTRPLDTGSSTTKTAPPTTGQTTVPSHPGTASVIVPGDPEKAIGEAIEAVLAPRPPGPSSAQTACGFYVTDRYLQTTYGTRQGCVDAFVPGSAADSVKISAIVVSGESATARAVPRGGPSSGETITVRLVRAGSIWKVDSLRSNAPVGP
jgi:hypothetical protein